MPCYYSLPSAPEAVLRSFLQRTCMGCHISTKLPSTDIEPGHQLAARVLFTAFANLSLRILGSRKDGRKPLQG